MADTLFGYSIDEQDGTLVVTLSGALADAAIRQLRQRIEGGERWPVAALLSPVLPLGRLLSSAIPLQSQAVASAPWTPNVDEEALNQQVDQTLAAFVEQLDEFRAALAELAGEQNATDVPSGAPEDTSVTPEPAQKPGAGPGPADAAEAEAATTAKAAQAPAKPAAPSKGSRRST